MRITTSVQPNARRVLWGTVLCWALGLLAAHAALPGAEDQRLQKGQALISRLLPEISGGYGYQLVYQVDVPIQIYWRFKTDFDNDFLVSNKLITAHRLVSRSGQVVITENEYTAKPGVIFRWQTTMRPSSYRLDFHLQNPRECGQKYHYGHIQLEARGQRTKVTQVAFFDFFGAGLWTHYPWYGGMTHFLEYTAQWEQETAVKLKDRYD